jgi:hypothetical protein
MYAICASETSSCRLLPLRGRGRAGDGDDDDDGRAAVRKERRRKRRVTDDRTARMAMLCYVDLGIGIERKVQSGLIYVGGGVLMVRVSMESMMCCGGEGSGCGTQVRFCTSANTKIAVSTRQ